MNKRIIYALCCPFLDDVHYIGKSTNGMLRPLEHCTSSHSDKVKKWVENLKDIGHSPKIKILERVSITDCIDSREMFWIQYYLNKGALLLNHTLVTPLVIDSDLSEILSTDKDKTIEKIGFFVKERRKKIGITQEKFSDKTGISLKVLRKIEQNKGNILLSSLLNVLDMFGCTIEVVKKNHIVPK